MLAIDWRIIWEYSTMTTETLLLDMLRKGTTKSDALSTLKITPLMLRKALKRIAKHQPPPFLPEPTKQPPPPNTVKPTFLTLYNTGRTNEEIAHILGVSTDSIEKRVENLLEQGLIKRPVHIRKPYTKASPYWEKRTY